MKHGSWNYKGYEDLDLDFIHQDIQRDWNCTLMSTINVCWGDIDTPCNIFISKRYIPILESNPVYNKDTRTITIGNNKLFIFIDIDTPRLYITKRANVNFIGIGDWDYSSVIIKGCDLPQYKEKYYGNIC